MRLLYGTRYPKVTDVSNYRCIINYSCWGTVNVNNKNIVGIIYPRLYKLNSQSSIKNNVEKINHTTHK
jgi:hypothetical protein